MIYGCGGGGGGDGSSTPASSAGVAVDPYLEGAVFCVDVNTNNVCDAGEPESTASDENGVFTFEDYSVQAGDIILMKTAGTHNGVPYLFTKMLAEYEGGDLVVSPLTTLLGRGLEPSDVVTLLDPDGTLGLTEALVSVDPIAVIAELDTVTEESLAAVRASIGAYMLLRMIDNNTDLADLTGDDLVNNADVQTLASNMMTVISEVITLDLIDDFQTLIDSYGDDTLPDVSIMDVIYTAVTVCDYVLELGEEAYQSTGNINGVVNAVNQFRNTNMVAFIENAAPAQYIYRLQRENQISGNNVPSALQGYTACTSGFHLGAHGLPMCYSETEDIDDASIMEIIANAPEIKYDIDMDELEYTSYSIPIVNSNFATTRDVDTSNPIGACYVYGIRYNASWYVPDADYYRCAVSKVADAGLLEDISGGEAYLNLKTDGINNFAKITYSSDTATVSLCSNIVNTTTTENARVVIARVGEGYSVESTMLLDNDYNASDPGGEVARGQKIFASANVSPTSEVYSFVLHFLNEQSSNCNGTAGDSTGSDDQCFLRFEGNIEHGLDAPENSGIGSSRVPSVEYSGGTYSKYDGRFTEKVYNDGSGLLFAGASFSAIVSGGLGYSEYLTVQDNAFALGGGGSETWYADKIRNFINMLSSYYEDIVTPTARTMDVPEITDPWDCQADAFIEIDLDTVEGMGDCTTQGIPGFAGAGDLTTCSEGYGSVNFQDLVQEYRCNADDPMTKDAIGCMPVPE